MRDTIESIVYGERKSSLKGAYGIQLALDIGMRYETERRNGTRIETRNIEETIRKAYADVTRSHRRSMAKLERARVFIAETTEAIELPEISADGMLIEDGFHRMRALLEMGISEMPMRIMSA